MNSLLVIPIPFIVFIAFVNGSRYSVLTVKFSTDTFVSSGISSLLSFSLTVKNCCNFSILWNPVKLKISPYIT